MGKLNQEDTILKNKIAERIKFLRVKTGLSPSEFAKAHDIDRQILSRWESKNNQRGITIYTINRFCNMLGITLKDFFDFEIDTDKE
jgi:transcriptional regulator with XRE-family HTH domain